MKRSPLLSQGCGRRRFASPEAAEKAAARGADGTPEECSRGGLVHWHLTGAPRKPLQAATGSSIPAAVRKIVLERDGDACVCCGVSIIGRRYSCGHRKNASQGGKAVPSNLITVLGWGGELCHGRIDSWLDPEDEAKGYAVRSYRNPLLIPVMIFSPGGSGMTVWLTDDGTYSAGPPGGVSAA